MAALVGIAPDFGALAIAVARAVGIAGRQRGSDRASRWKAPRAARSEWPEDSLRVARSGEVGFFAEPRRDQFALCTADSAHLPSNTADLGAFRLRLQADWRVWGKPINSERSADIRSAS